MAAPLNSKPVDLHTLNWQAALEKGTLAGHDVKAMSEAVAGKKASDLTYNSKAKTISYGPHILKLNEVAAAEPSLSLSSVWHWASLSLSSDYEQEHQNNLSHLAKLIEEKLQLDRKIGSNKEVIIPLHDAIQKDDLPRVLELIRSGVDLDVRDEKGNTPLMLTKNPTIQDALIQGGADVNARNSEGEPILEYAILNDPLLAQKLIDAKADVNAMSDVGIPPIAITIIDNNLPLFKSLIDAKADLNAVIVSDHYNKISPIEVAIQENRLELAHVLLAAGADINHLDDNLESTPLIRALYSNNQKMLTTLIELGADVNKAKKPGMTPLFIALLSSETMFTELLNAGANINHISEQGHSLLQGAVLLEDVNKVKFLLLKGADPNLGFPLGDAINFGNIPIIEELVKVANVYSLSPKQLSIIEHLKMTRPENYRAITKIILEKGPELKERNKELRYRLNLSHAWHLSGTTSLTHPKFNDSSSDLEGAKSDYWIRQIHKNFDSFLASYPDLLENPNTLKSALEHAFVSKSIDEDLKRIQAGLLTFIDTGYKKHAVTVLVWKNQFIICNRGGSTRAPIEVYHFDPKLLTPNILKAIKNGEGTVKDYQTLFFDVLPKKLNFTQTPLDIRLQQAYPLPPQSVGNCSWVSLTTAIYTYMLFSGVLGEKEGQLLDQTPKDFNQTIIHQVAIYRTWLLFEQISSLEKMLKLIGKTEFEPDHELIQRGIRKAYFIGLDPKTILGSKLEAFTTQYTSTLNSEQALLFKTNLECWKMEAKMALPKAVRINL